MSHPIPVQRVNQPNHPEVEATFDRLAKSTVGLVNIHRTIANSPVVFSRFIGFAHGLRNETDLDPAERELAILCVLERHQGEYELGHHRHMALSLGLSKEQVTMVRDPDACSEYSDRQRAILLFAENFAANPEDQGSFTDTNITQFLDNRQVIELALTKALYIGLAHFTRAIDVPEDEH